MRLPAAFLQMVQSDHILSAVRRLEAGETGHGFGEASGYHLLTDDGQRLAPKAVFGLAAREALGFRGGPEHFTGGTDSLCVRQLRRAGCPVVPQGSRTARLPEDTDPDDPPMPDEDLRAAEGRPSLPA